MGLFKSKEEKEFERKVLIRNTINKLKNHLKLLEKNKDYWLDKAIEAKNKGWDQQYILAKNGLKIILEQEKKCSLMLARVELANQVKEFSLLGKDFLTGITSVCRQISKISNSMDFGVATKEFELAMEKCSKDMDKMDAHLENKPNQGLGTEFAGESLSIDDAIDDLVSSKLSSEEEEWEEMNKSMNDDFFGSGKQEQKQTLDGGNDFSDFSDFAPVAPKKEAPKNIPEEKEEEEEEDEPVVPQREKKAASKPEGQGNSKLKGWAMRPQTLQDYFGQPKAVKILEEVIAAAKKRDIPLGHILLYGGPGLGKTTLANIIANEMGTHCIELNGPALKQVSDLIAVISNVGEGDIVFIDEIHRVPKAVSEVIYTAMEDFRLCYFEGTGEKRRNVNKELPPFTLIGATTDPGLLARPFKARMTTQIHLYPYDAATMKFIILNAAKKQGIVIADDLAMQLAERCQETPRLAINYVKSLANKLIAKDKTEATQEVLDELYEDIGVDKAGLTTEQQSYIRNIIEKFNGGPVGLDTISSCIDEDRESTATIHEPYLLLKGFINILRQGRVATEKAYKHLGLDVPDNAAIRQYADEVQTPADSAEQPTDAPAEGKGNDGEDQE